MLAENQGPTGDDSLSQVPTALSLTQGSSVESASPTRSTGLLSRLGENPTLRKAALAISTIFGGASIPAITGCAPEASYTQQLNANRTLIKEAKFSTLGANADISLAKMPELLASSEKLRSAVDTAITPTRQLVTHFEADHMVSVMGLDSLKAAMPAIEVAAQAMLDNSQFVSAKDKLTQLLSSVQEVQKLTSEDFRQQLESVGYSKTNTLMQNLYDWDDALGLDTSHLKRGVHALDIVQLSESLTQTSISLKTVDGIESVSMWISGHSEDAAKIGATISTSVSQIAKNIGEPAFAPVHEDLGDLKTLLMDLSKIFPTSTAEAFPVTQDERSEKALVKETIALLDAFTSDLKRELTQTLGVASTSLASNGGGAPVAHSSNSASSGSAASNHSHSGSTFLWFMRSPSPGYSGYSYTPTSTHQYSGNSALRSSNEYSSFKSTSEANHSTLSRAGGSSAGSAYSSHSSGPLGRAPSATARSGGFGTSSGISSASHSSSSSHVGGFSSGRSSSAGFGG